MNKLIPVLFTALIFLLIDLYAFQAIKVAIANSSMLVKRIVTILYWSVTLFSIAGLVAFRIGDPEIFGRKTRTFIITGIASNYLIKFFMILIL
jgi:uncharacterized protein